MSARLIVMMLQAPAYKPLFTRFCIQSMSEGGSELRSITGRSALATLKTKQLPRGGLLPRLNRSEYKAHESRHFALRNSNERLYP